MRPLTEPETKALFNKLANYTGQSLKQLIQAADGPGNERNVFRVSGSRVYYVRESLANLATSVARDKLLSLGTCIGKISKSGKFRVKPNGEMPLLYGSNISKAHVGRWSEDCPQHQGVVFYNMADTPLGFGTTARSTAEANRLDPTAIVAFRQADVGEYLREEDNLFAT